MSRNLEIPPRPVITPARSPSYLVAREKLLERCQEYGSRNPVYSRPLSIYLPAVAMAFNTGVISAIWVKLSFLGTLSDENKVNLSKVSLAFSAMLFPFYPIFVVSFCWGRCTEAQPSAARGQFRRWAEHPGRSKFHWTLLAVLLERLKVE